MKRFLAFAAALALACPPALAENAFICEVIGLEGESTVEPAAGGGIRALADGDALSDGDQISVGPGAWIQIAYDGDSKNVSRLEENSDVKIRSVQPTELYLARGGVFAELEDLPEESGFLVATPAAITSVRGTSYRTTHVDGETEVFNYSSSPVYLFDADDAERAKPVTIENFQKARLERRGAPPRLERMSDAEFARGGEFRRDIRARIQRNAAQGRVPRAPRLDQIRQRLREGGTRGDRPMLAGENAPEARQRQRESERRRERMEGDRPSRDGGDAAPERQAPGSSTIAPEGRAAEGRTPPPGGKKVEGAQEGPQQNGGDRPKDRRPRPDRRQGGQQKPPPR